MVPQDGSLPTLLVPIRGCWSTEGVRPLPRHSSSTDLFFPEIHKQFICHYVVGLPGEGVIRKICGPKIKVQFPPPLKDEGLTWPVRVTVLDGQGATLFKDTFEAKPLFEDVVPLSDIRGRALRGISSRFQSLISKVRRV